MTDILDKMLNAGIGAIVMTKERAEQIVDEFVRKGEVRREEGKQMVEELLDRGEKKKKEFRADIKDMVQDALRQLNIPTKEDIAKIHHEIDLLKKSKSSEREVHKLKSEVDQLKEREGE